MSDNPDACRCLLQGKGIGGEFRDECAALIREGMGPSAIIDTLTVKYQKRPHLNPKKVLRIPSENTLKGLRASMYNGPGSEIKDNTQLLAWCSGRMCTTKADFDKLTEEDDNKLLVLATFCREVEVDVEPALPQLGVGVDVEVRRKREAIWYDAKIITNKGDGNFEVLYDEDDTKEVLHPKFIRAKMPPVTKEKKLALGLVMSSRRMLLVLMAILKAGGRIALQSDGTYRLHQDGWTTVDAGTHDINFDEAKRRFVHSFYALMYVFCRTECMFTYLVLCNILKGIGPMLFGIDLQLDATHGGMDRTPYIANAYLTAWPSITLMMCWPHLIRKFKEAELKKALQRPENWAAIEKAIVMMHFCRSPEQHLWLGPIIFALWADVLQEPAFATLFERIYFADDRGAPSARTVSSCRGHRCARPRRGVARADHRPTESSSCRRLLCRACRR